MVETSFRSSPETGPRRGRQRPRISVCAGLEHSTDGDDAADLVADLGMVLFPWERYVLGRWLARDPFDRFSCLTSQAPKALQAWFGKHDMLVTNASSGELMHRVRMGIEPDWPRIVG